MTTKDDGVMRSFDTGATRDTAEGKLDFEGFLHPLFMEQFAKYMNMHRLQSDGKLRDSDNWQKGIPQDICMKSAFRHFFEMWKAHRAGAHCRRSYHDLMAGAMGLMFNIQAYVLHDLQDDNKGTVDFDGAEPTEEMRERQEKIKEKQVAEVGDSCSCDSEVTIGRMGDFERSELPRGEEPDTGRIYGFAMPSDVDDDGYCDECGWQECECENDVVPSCFNCRFTTLNLSEHPCDCCNNLNDPFSNFSPK